MTVQAEGVVRHLFSEFPFRLDNSSSVTVETGLVLGPFMHGNHLRILAVAYGASERGIMAH